MRFMVLIATALVVGCSTPTGLGNLPKKDLAFATTVAAYDSYPFYHSDRQAQQEARQYLKGGSLVYYPSLNRAMAPAKAQAHGYGFEEDYQQLWFREIVRRLVEIRHEGR